MASRFARKALPAAAATIFTSSSFFSNPSANRASCDANPASQTSSSSPSPSKPLQNAIRKKAGMDSSETGDFHKLFPKRQLWQPKVEYPLWDPDWDGLEPVSTGNKDDDRRRKRQLRKYGVTRHVILIRHGQYNEQEKLDENRKLTPLGREQADYTGKRLREMIEGVAGTGFTGCNVKVVRVSNMARAKETADIIASHLPSVERAEPDPDLNEGRPAHNLPGGSASTSTIEKTDEHHPRIEAAFEKYFYRAKDLPKDKETGDDEDHTDENNPKDPNSGEQKEGSRHEFEVIVCHANVIRYFLCRALQIPPEAWLRLCTFNCSLTYLTIRPTGTVSCRMLGDIGHLPYGMSTFSSHPGFNW